MTFAKLLEAQWSDYPERHQNRTNLLVHIVAVPLLWLGAFQAFGGLLLVLLGVPGAFGMVFWGAVLMAASLGAQHWGNSLEAGPARRIKDPKEFARHAVAEQFITFPRFVVTGAWLENLKKAV